MRNLKGFLCVTCPTKVIQAGSVFSSVQLCGKMREKNVAPTALCLCGGNDLLPICRASGTFFLFYVPPVPLL
jgi:hypothetical protein